jgi:type IV secretory pathway VirB2 component (pilin)
MRFKSIITGLAAVAMMATPTISAAQAGAGSVVVPAEETVEGSELRGGMRGNVAAILALLGVAGVAYLVIKALLEDKDALEEEPRPVSP